MLTPRRRGELLTALSATGSNEGSAQLRAFALDRVTGHNEAIVAALLDIASAVREQTQLIRTGGEDLQ